METGFLQGKSKNEQIGEIWKYLDELALNDPEKYNQFIKKTLEDGKKEGLGPPAPKFVIQTHKVPKMIPIRELFINASQWAQIPGPASSRDAVKIIASDLREELIQDRMCFTIDVAVSVKVMEQCLASEEEKGLLIDLMIRYVEAMNNCKLDTNYKIIEQVYKGNRDNLLDMMCPVSLREAAKESSSGFSEEKLIKEVKKMATDESRDEVNLDIGGDSGVKTKLNDIILPSRESLNNELFLSESNREQTKDKRELDSVEENDNAFSKNVTKVEGKVGNTKEITLKKPKYIIRSEVRGHDKFEVIEIDLPGVTKIDDCDLDVGEDSLSLEVPQMFALNLNFDNNIDEDGTEAYFVRTSSKLIVKMKCLNS